MADTVGTKYVILPFIVNHQGFFFCVAAAQRGPWPPYSWGFLDHTQLQSVGLLWTSDQLGAETSTWQHPTLTTDKLPCPSGIRTYDHRRRAAADLRRRPRGHWDRQSSGIILIKIKRCKIRSFWVLNLWHRRNLTTSRRNLLPSSSGRKHGVMSQKTRNFDSLQHDSLKSHKPVTNWSILRLFRHNFSLIFKLFWQRDNKWCKMYTWNWIQDCHGKSSIQQEDSSHQHIGIYV